MSELKAGVYHGYLIRPEEDEESIVATETKKGFRKIELKFIITDKKVKDGFEQLKTPVAATVGVGIDPDNERFDQNVNSLLGIGWNGRVRNDAIAFSESIFNEGTHLTLKLNRTDDGKIYENWYIGGSKLKIDDETASEIEDRIAAIIKRSCAVTPPPPPPPVPSRKAPLPPAASKTETESAPATAAKPEAGKPSLRPKVAPPPPPEPDDAQPTVNNQDDAWAVWFDKADGKPSIEKWNEAITERAEVEGKDVTQFDASDWRAVAAVADNAPF